MGDTECDENIAPAEVSAKSPHCNKSTEKGRPGVTFGLHFDSFWEAFVLKSMFFVHFFQSRFFIDLFIDFGDRDVG